MKLWCIYLIEQAAKNMYSDNYLYQSMQLNARTTCWLLSTFMSQEKEVQRMDAQDKACGSMFHIS